MFILTRLLFHFICSIGRFCRKLIQFIIGRRHDELGTSISKTEPVTLEHIRIIGEMENDTNRPYQSFTSAPKVNRRMCFSSIYFCYIRSHKQNGILGVLRIYSDKQNS
jgi:hypothetical protein